MVPIQYLTGSLLNDNIIFYKKSAWRYTSSCEAEVVIMAQKSSSTLWERYLAVVKCNRSRKLKQTLRANCMTSSVTRYNS
jgi:hypothetical protein